MKNIQPVIQSFFRNTRIFSSPHFIVFFIFILVFIMRNIYSAELTVIGSPVYDNLLESAQDVVVSPDGKHVYVTSHWRQGALAAYSRGTTTGLLTYIQDIKCDPNNGISWPHEIVISKDGKFMYVAGGGEDSVAFFSRNATTGLLTFVEVERGGQTWSGLDDCQTLALSPDEKNLYACGLWDGTLVTFARNTTTGGIDFQNVLKNNYGGLTNFSGPQGIAVSPDGTEVYVATKWSDSLFVFNRNTTTGQLTFSKRYTNGSDGMIGLLYPVSVYPSSDGKNVYVACWNYGLLVLSRNPTTGILTFLENHRNGAPSDEFMGGANQINITSDGTKLLLTCNGDHSLTLFQRDTATGKLKRINGMINHFAGVRLFHWPNGVSLSPDDSFVYACANEDSLTCFKLGPNPDQISLVQMTEGGRSSCAPGLREPEITAMSPDGLNLYVAASWGENEVTCFRRDATSGLLTHLQTVGEYDTWLPEYCTSGTVFVIVSKDGKNVYSSSINNNCIASFQRDLSDGHLEFLTAYYDNTGGIDGLDDPIHLTISPDDKFIYVSSYPEDTVAWFERLADGTLTFKNIFYNGTGGCDRLDRPAGIAISPDGNFLYVCTEEDDAVVIFSRNKTTGDLTYLGFVTEGLGSVDGLDGAHCLVISPDGKHIYAGAWNDDGIVCFSRNMSTGMLTFVESKKFGLGKSVRSLAINSTGTKIYAPFPDADAIAAISRNTTTGKLTVLQQISLSTTDGLNYAYNVSISPDNKYIYVGSFDDDCLRIFGTSAMGSSSETWALY